MSNRNLSLPPRANDPALSTIANVQPRCRQTNRGRDDRKGSEVRRRAVLDSNGIRRNQSLSAVLRDRQDHEVNGMGHMTSVSPLLGCRKNIRILGIGGFTSNHFPGRNPASSHHPRSIRKDTDQIHQETTKKRVHGPV